MKRSLKVATAAAAAALGCAGLGVLAVPATAATPAPSAKAAACDRAPWEGAVQGTPKSFSAGDRGGDYLWHDTHGFRLRVTHGKNHDQRTYSGVITASSAMRLDPVKLERGDVVKLSANRRSLVFVFANHGYVDGVNFHTDCATRLEVSRLHVGNSNLSASQVYLGAKRAHPKAVPFAVHRKPGVHA
ncbi:hypothetical protein [uncultured Jatrophihabitans sp.]|uniref:hypothetical protein n=1 Tax=uncultured Jatrophihabitans sp. TaxID=1610747 RepID=UPI0035CA5F45